MQYKFNFISTDNYELEYKNKNNEIIKKPFKRNVELAREIQSIQAEGRSLMLESMTKKGKTRDDYIIKRLHADGTITYDESNLRANEEMFIGIATLEILKDIVKNLFNMTLEKLFLEMGVDINSNNQEDQNKVLGFITKFCNILSQGLEEESAPPYNENQE